MFSAKRTQALAFSIGFMILVFSVLGFVMQPEDRYTSDLYPTWAAAQLIGQNFYNPGAIAAIQRTVTSKIENRRFIRPPFYAALMWPLSWFSFPVAYVLWQLFNLAAAIVFVKAWRFEPASYMVCALYLPLGWSFGLGQDSPLMLLILAGGAYFVERKQPLAGGAILALCSIKPHLFAFVPLVLVVQRRYRALAGMAAAGAVLYLVSAALLGFGWPSMFIRAAIENEASISPHLLGVAGLLQRVHAPVWITPAAYLIGAAIVWLATRGQGWMPSVAFAAAAGASFAPHSLVYDASLFLPLLLLQASPTVAIAVGAVLLSIVTPVAVISEIAALVVLWIARPGTVAEIN